MNFVSTFGLYTFCALATVIKTSSLHSRNNNSGVFVREIKRSYDTVKTKNSNNASPKRIKNNTSKRNEKEREISDLSKWVLGRFDIESFNKFFMEITKKDLSVFKDDYGSKFYEVIYVFAQNLLSTNPSPTISKFSEIFKTMLNQEKNNSNLPEEFVTDHQTLLKAIRDVIKCYNSFIKALKTAANRNYEGKPLYEEVMNFTSNTIDKKRLHSLLNFLKSSKGFYEAFIVCNNNPPQQDRRIFLVKIYEKVKSNIALCEKREELMDAFLNMSKYKNVNISPYLNRCDFDEVHLNNFVVKIVESNPLANAFFDAFIDFAKERVKYLGECHIQAGNYLNCAQKMKNQYSISTPPPLPLFDATVQKRRRNPPQSVSGPKKFCFNDVAASKELILKDSIKQIRMTKNDSSNFNKVSQLLIEEEYVIYQATDNRTRNQVAIKIYTPTTKKSLKSSKEAYYMNLLKDAPFICQLVEYWEEKTKESERVYDVLVMKFAGKLTLRDYFNTKSWGDAILRKWMSQIVVAVQHMHARGIIHRDLKLANIFITDSYDVQVFDFGVSKRFKQNPILKKRQQRGTLFHISPEIYLGQRVSYESDIFAVGMIFYHFLCGDLNILKHEYQELDKLITERKNGYQEKLAQQSRLFVKLPIRNNAPAGAEELFRGMVHPDPQKRFTLVQIMQSEYFKTVDWRKLGALEAPLPLKEN